MRCGDPAADVRIAPVRLFGTYYEGIPSETAGALEPDMRPAPAAAAAWTATAAHLPHARAGGLGPSTKDFVRSSSCRTLGSGGSRREFGAAGRSRWGWR